MFKKYLLFIVSVIIAQGVDDVGFDDSNVGVESDVIIDNSGDFTFDDSKNFTLEDCGNFTLVDDNGNFTVDDHGNFTVHDHGNCTIVDDHGNFTIVDDHVFENVGSINTMNKMMIFSLLTLILV